MTLQAGNSTLWADAACVGLRRVHTPTLLDATRVWIRLVSGSVTLRFEFLPTKSRQKPRLSAFTDRTRPGLLAAAFKPRAGRVLADLGRLGDCNVVARPPMGERRIGGC